MLSSKIKLDLLILAGGLGTRLKSVLPTKPKALAPAQGFPFLKYQIKNWRDQGVTSFVFLLHYQAEQIISYVNSERNALLKDCSIRFIVEKDPLDTGGAIVNALHHAEISWKFMVANADTWIVGGIRDLMFKDDPHILTVHQENISRYGSIECDQHNFVTKIVEKRQDVKLTAGWINSGLYLLNQELFSSYTPRKISFEREIMPELVDRRLLRALKIQTEFIDIGIPEDYLKFVTNLSIKE